MENIDIVVLWVDGSDPKWIKKRQQYSGEKSIDEVRYRDYGSLKYLFRSIERYCPWVNKVFLITDHQIPDWLNQDNPKLKIVFHDEFIPQEYLPTFNSNVIELNLFRIKELSEKFILFNDDMFFNGITKPEDFYHEDKILDFGVYNKIAPNEEFSHTLVNNLIFINEHFSKRDSLKKNWKKQFRLRYGKELLKNFLLLPWSDIPGYYNPHLPQPHFKSVFEELYKLNPEMFEKTFKNRFRGYDDINHWICRYWLLEEGRYEPQHLSFGGYYTLSEKDKITQAISKENEKILCIEDESSDQISFEEWIKNLLAAFEIKFPQKSSFEQ